MMVVVEWHVGIMCAITCNPTKSNFLSHGRLSRDDFKYLLYAMFIDAISSIGYSKYIAIAPVHQKNVPLASGTSLRSAQIDRSSYWHNMSGDLLGNGIPLSCIK